MIDELITIEQLERIKRQVETGFDQLALATLNVMIQERKARVEQFELEVQGGMNA